MIFRLMQEPTRLSRQSDTRQVCMLQCERNSGEAGWACRFLWRTGAGCRGGWTAYLAYRSGSNLWRHRHRGVRRKLIEFGITRNANIVPYASR